MGHKHGELHIWLHPLFPVQPSITERRKEKRIKEEAKLLIGEKNTAIKLVMKLGNMKRNGDVVWNRENEWSCWGFMRDFRYSFCHVWPQIWFSVSIKYLLGPILCIEGVYYHHLFALFSHRHRTRSAVFAYSAATNYFHKFVTKTVSKSEADHLSLTGGKDLTLLHYRWQGKFKVSNTHTMNIF